MPQGQSAASAFDGPGIPLNGLDCGDERELNNEIRIGPRSVAYIQVEAPGKRPISKGAHTKHGSAATIISDRNWMASFRATALVLLLLLLLLV